MAELCEEARMKRIPPGVLHGPNPGNHLISDTFVSLPALRSFPCLCLTEQCRFVVRFLVACGFAFAHTDIRSTLCSTALLRLRHLQQLALDGPDALEVLLVRHGYEPRLVGVGVRLFQRPAEAVRL